MRYQYATAIDAYMGAASTILNIYQGTIPNNANDLLIDNRIAHLLVSFAGSTITSATGTVSLTSFPTPSVVNATGTGLATWACVMNATTQISASKQFFVCDVTDTLGDGVILIDDVNCVTGNPVQFIDLNFSFNP